MSTALATAGWIGGGLTVLAYGLLMVRYVSPTSLSFQVMNTLGGLLLIGSAIEAGAAPNAVIAATWFAIGLYGLVTRPSAATDTAADRGDSADPPALRGPRSPAMIDGLQRLRTMNVLDQTAEVIRMLDAPCGLWLDGRSVGAARTFTVHDPASFAPIAAVADGSPGDAAKAVGSAARALPGWASTTPGTRAEALRRTGELMVAATHEMAALIVAENGKPQADAVAEVTYAAEIFRWYAEEAVRADSDHATAPVSGARTFATHRPLGVAALVTAWSFPAVTAARKVAPALAAGCTVVLEPAEETPLTALFLARVLKQAGVPDGVVNVVPTTDPRAVVDVWLKAPQVRALSLTGSTGGERGLRLQAADRRVHTSPQLGGHAPFVVTADADVDAAVAGAVLSKFRGTGQACTGADGFYVHADVLDQFAKGFGVAIESLVVGPGSDPASQVGPLISQREVRRIRDLVDDALAEGASVTAEASVPETGHFFPPTLLTGVQPGATILTEESLGPVAPLVEWSDEEDLVRQLNDTESGLAAAYVYAGRLQDALKLAERIEAGMVGINRGMVFEPAGSEERAIGREGAREGIREFQETQYFSVDLA